MLPPYCPPLNPVLGKDLVPYSGPVWGPEEITAACASLQSGRWLPAGEQVQKFERAFSRTFGHAASLMVNSGSSANLIMLSAAKKCFGWRDGDEVIVSAVGFPTTVAPVVQCGLTPVFCDIEMRTLNFDLDEVERAITKRTRCILLSPVLGNAPDMARLTSLLPESSPESLSLLLDGCDSLGSLWAGNPLSDYAHLTSCSFFPAHHICTGEGGMVSADNLEVIKIARRFAHWGRDCYCIGSANANLPCGTCGKRNSDWLGCGVEIDHRYYFTEMGYNLKPLDLQGAIGLEQLKRWPHIRSRRREIYARLSAHIEKHTDCVVPKELPGAETCWFGVPVVCPTPERKRELTERLDKALIQWRNYFAGNLLLHPGYAHLGNAADYPNANKVLPHVFFLGCYPQYSEETLCYIEDQFSQS